MDVTDDEVSNYLAELIAFKALNEGSVQPSRQSSRIVYKVTEAELGGWIDYVNRNWKLKGFLTEIQILMLKEVGFPFLDTVLDEGWELGF